MIGIVSIPFDEPLVLLGFAFFDLNFDLPYVGRSRFVYTVALFVLAPVLAYSACTFVERASEAHHECGDVLCDRDVA